MSDGMMCCASCGTAEVDDIKLKKCTACHLVKYCSVKCQKEHRTQHKRACKKRASELRDEILFNQPESSDLGHCPICCLPLPINARKSILCSCCSKTICIGCAHANQQRELQGKLEQKCPYCRHPLPKSVDEAELNHMKRVQVNDPDALRHMGLIRHDEGDYEGAFEYYTKAARLGNAGAHFELSRLYQMGHGVEKDEKMELHHLEEAAIGGNPSARHNLGCIEKENGRIHRAVKHFIIAAKLGTDDSLENVRGGFRLGLVSKEDFASALRGHQSAVDETKSLQRDAAEESKSFRQRKGRQN
jgi:hypothetical protein